MIRVVWLLCRRLAPQILKKFSPFEVVKVVLVLVGFLLETDVAVGFHAVAVLDEEDEPLDAVPKEEGQVEQLPLLCRVDEFVVELHFIQRTDGEDEATQADGKEVLAQKDLPD